ncbi:MAG: hypothetical protein D6696_18590 [Acidobacteria bacterium]|nr:MAG: hypothetical protein D6696_18590 [Acidobacteriota bacterium]
MNERRRHGPIEEEEAADEPVNLGHGDLPDDPGDPAAGDDPLIAALRWEAAIARPRPGRRRSAGRPLPIEEEEAADEPVNLGHGDLPDDLLGRGPRQLARRLARGGAAQRAERLDELARCLEYERNVAEEEEHHRRRRELPSDLDPHDLEQTGWGVVYPEGQRGRIERLLGDLIFERERQAGRALFKMIPVPPGITPRDFWRRHDVSPGVIDPAKLPYYLVIAGDPRQIPFELQYQLAINRAVGRLHFDDPAGYRRYAEHVLAAESRTVQRPRRAVLFSVDNGDDVSRLLADYLAAPLAERLPSFLDRHLADWRFELWRGEESDKDDLIRLLGGDATPALVLASCHGLRLTVGNPYQRAYQGALACRRADDQPPGAHLFHAGDLDGADVRGLIAFLFNCFGAGTPRFDNFPHESDGGTLAEARPPAELAAAPFVARLPQALLAGGALAVVGHVDRGWTLSFSWTLGERPSEAVRSLEDSLKLLLAGHRLGHALRPLHRRYAALAAHLAAPLERLERGEDVDGVELGVRWTAHNDARNFIVLGDPAVYLRGRPDRTAAVPLSGDRRVRLADDVLHFAVEAAGRRRLSVADWVNRTLRAQMSTAGLRDGGRRE